MKPRYENKYLVDLSIMDALMDRLKDVMDLDPNAENGGYHVNSIYYDTADYQAFYDKIDGMPNRCKIRLRYYGETNRETDLSKVSVFMEAKHRRNNLIYKDRIKVHGTLIPDFAEELNLHSKLWNIASENQRYEASLVKNVLLQGTLVPFCLVSYFRVPFFCRINPTLRITYDINLRASGASNCMQTAQDNGLTVLPKHIGIVEIKFHWAMPLWLHEICRELGMGLRRYSKYCSSMERLYPFLA